MCCEKRKPATRRARTFYPRDWRLETGAPALLSQPLTDREFEVLKLLAQGRTNREIARELLVSVGTVKAYVQRIIAKLEVSDRTQAAVKATELGILSC